MSRAETTGRRAVCVPEVQQYIHDLPGMTFPLTLNTIGQNRYIFRRSQNELCMPFLGWWDFLKTTTFGYDPLYKSDVNDLSGLFLKKKSWCGGTPTGADLGIL